MTFVDVQKHGFAASMAAWKLQHCYLLSSAYGRQWLYGPAHEACHPHGATLLQAVALLEVQHAAEQAGLEHKAAGQELAALRAEIASTAEQLEACREQHKQQQTAQQHVQDEMVQVYSAAADVASCLCAVAALPSHEC